MSYSLIKGTFHIHYPLTPRNGPEPDGDTIKFMPDDRRLIDRLPRPNRPPKFTQSGITTLRLEGIDALETHFSIAGTEYHQEMNLALAARDKLLDEMGFGTITYFQNAEFKVETVENHPIRGYILSNGLDTFGRTICFVYTRDHPAIDGSAIFVESEMLDASLNAFLLRVGQAYPAFYLTLPADLRQHLTNIVTTARDTGVGLWASATASTTTRATINDAATLQQLVIWPKLFRRLAAFFQDGHNNLIGFDSWLREDPVNRDDRLLLPNLELGNMHDLIVVVDDTVGLSHPPEDVVIVPDDYVLTEPENPVVTPVYSGPIRIIAALVDSAERPERGNETVTLINVTDQVIDLTGWHLADRSGQQQLTGMLSSGEAVRIQLSSRIQLSNVRDTITLLDANGKIVDQVAYEPRDLPGEGYTLVF